LWELYCFDFSVAFDIIDHNLLLKKLLCYGISTSAISWIQSYLSYRTQRVFFNGSFSNVKHVKCGVPQGSSLGPLHFSIFTNDLPLALNKTCVSICADESTTSATTANEVTETFNKELQSVLEWVVSSRLVLTISKTKSIVFGTNHCLSSRPLILVMNGVAVEQVSVIKRWLCFFDTTQASSAGPSLI
jgi:hypothetical protein